MTELNTDAGAAGSEQQPMTEIRIAGEGHLSVTDAARALAGARQHKPKDLPPPASRGQQPGGEQRAEGTAQQQPAHESAVEAGATPPDAEVRGETEHADPGAELSPIEQTRSWTKED